MSKRFSGPAALVWLLVAIVLGVGIVRLLSLGMTHRSPDQKRLIDKAH